MFGVKGALLIGLLLFWGQYEQTKGDKILVLTFFSSPSHKITYMGLIEELARRGHKITIVTPVKGKPNPNITEIFTFDMDEQMKKAGMDFNVFKMKEEGKDVNPFLMVDAFQSICNMCYEHPGVQALLKEQFDLIFMQPMFNDCALGLAYRLKAPLVLFAPTSVPGFMVNKLGGHFPASFVSNIFLGMGDEMSFWQRFKNLGINFMLEAILRLYYEPAMEALYRKQLGQDIPGIPQIFGNASLLLSNGHFSLSKPKPYLPDTIDVGGIHSRPAKPLPKDLEDFIQKGGDAGFILFSMGSAIKGHQMSEERRQLFINVFSKLKQQVLWKWETETMANLPPNVRLSKWLPQQDLLGHPKVKTFITHCGGGSTEEAIYHGVPLIGMPMFGDQDLNARQAESNGYLIQLDWMTLTEQQLSDAVSQVINNQTYKENVKRLSKIFRDQPDLPLERGVWWVEYVLRHKGAPQLRSASRKLNLFQYHCYDVIGLYLLLLLALVCVAVGLLRWGCRRLCGCGGSRHSASNLQRKKRQ